MFWYFTYLFIRKKNHSIIQTFSIWKPQIEIKKDNIFRSIISKILTMAICGEKIKKQEFVTLCCIEYTSSWMVYKLTTLVVMGTDCTGSCKSNYHTFMTVTAPTYLSVWGWYWTDKIIKYRNIYLIKGKRKIVNYIWLVHSFIFLFLQFIHSFAHPWSRVVVIFIIVCHTTNFKTIDSWKSCHAVNVHMLIMLHELVSVYIYVRLRSTSSL